MHTHARAWWVKFSLDNRHDWLHNVHRHRISRVYDVRGNAKSVLRRDVFFILPIACFVCDVQHRWVPRPCGCMCVWCKINGRSSLKWFIFCWNLFFSFRSLHYVSRTHRHFAYFIRAHPANTTHTATLASFARALRHLNLFFCSDAVSRCSLASPFGLRHHLRFVSRILGSVCARRGTRETRRVPTRTACLEFAFAEFGDGATHDISYFSRQNSS